MRGETQRAQRGGRVVALGADPGRATTGVPVSDAQRAQRVQRVPGPREDEPVRSAVDGPAGPRPDGEGLRVEVEGSEVGADVVRSGLRRRGQQLGGVRDTGEHQQRRHLGRAAALDVRVEAVADHERCRGPHPSRGRLHQGGSGLPRHLRLEPGRGSQDRHQGPVAGQRAALARQRRVDVARHPHRARPQRDARLGERRVAQLGIEALDDGGRAVRRVDGRQADRGDLCAECRGADHEHLGPVGQLLGEQRRGGLRAGGDVVGPGRITQLGQMRGDVTG